jgi:hypothetical protein
MNPYSDGDDRHVVVRVYNTRGLEPAATRSMWGCDRKNATRHL